MASGQDEDRDDDSIGTQVDIEQISYEAAKMVAVYTRNDPDSVSESLNALLSYAERELGYEFGSDARKSLVDPDTDDTDELGGGKKAENGFNGASAIYDLQETYPRGLEGFTNFVTEYKVADVVAPALATFGNVETATRKVEHLQDNGVTIHLIQDGLVIDPSDERASACFAAARRATKSDVDKHLVTERGTGVEWDSGQPPAGFTVGSAGYLERNDDWETIRQAAKSVESDEMTLYRASEITGISRHAIRTALEKYHDLYRIDESDPLTFNTGADNEGQ